MPKSFLNVLVLILSFSAFSQNTVTVKGKLLDSTTQLPLEAATVYLSNVADSTVIDYTITDKNGFFLMNTRKINKPVFLKISYIGYKTFQQEMKTLDENRDFGVVRLEENENTLGEVIVKAEAPPIRIKNDTLEFNVSSFKVRPDANVEALLKQLPGVEIDAEGKITVNGKEVNQILVNGKPFFDKDGKVALQNLPSDIINKVQITDTKTKKEEISGTKASANEASINLTIDEEKNKGFFGKVMGGIGSDKRYESSLMFNYFKGDRKVSVIGSANNINSTGFSMNEIFDSMGGGRNYSVYTSDDGGFGINNMRFGGGKGITESKLLGVNYTDQLFKGFESTGSYFYNAANAENTNRTKQQNFATDGNYTTESFGKTQDDKFAHNVNFNIQYKIDSTATLYINPKFIKAKSQFRNQSEEFSTTENGRLMNENTRDNIDETNNFTFGNNLYFYKSFKRKGRGLSVSFNNDNKKEEVSNLNRSFNTFYEDLNQDGVTDNVREDNRNQVRLNKTLTDNYYAELEFTEPIRDSLAVKVGVEYERERFSEDRRGFNFDVATGMYGDPDATLTNDLLSVINTSSPYTGIQIEKKKYNIGMTLGTSITKFETSSQYLGTETNLSRNYIYPKARVYGNYKFTKSKSIWMSYNYEVNFPRAFQVLPVSDISDPLNTIIGNPLLDPNKYHNVYFSFRDYDFATKSGYNIHGGGNYNESQVVSSVAISGSGQRTTEYINVSDSYNSWFGGNWNKTIKKGAHSFKYGFGLNGGFSFIKGFINEELYTAKQLRFNPRANFTYDYGELVSIMPTYNYTFNNTDYTNFRFGNASSFVHKLNVQTTTYWPKHVVFGNDFGYTYNSDIAGGFKKDFYLWNTSLGYNFFGDQLLAKVKVYDMLNQNQNTSRTISANFIRDEENTVLKRYVMFSLTYKLDKFAGKKITPKR